jgi:hypothetical protein
MRLLSVAWELWCDLPRTRQIGICAGVVFCALGLPRSELGLVWYEARSAFGLQNCVEDAAAPLLSAIDHNDSDAMSEAVAPARRRQLSECGSKTLQHPKTTLAFLRDEHRRMEAIDARRKD